MTKILLCCAAFLLLTGCVGPPKLPVATNPTPIGQISDKKTAQGAWRDSQVRKYGEIWTRESNPGGDHYVAGQAAYYLALSTSEPTWSKAAITSFESALKTDLALPERARAGLGAANRLQARDYPIKGAAEFLALGTPRMLRLNLVRKSVSNLNRAVEAAPYDPIVRLYRASAFVGIPTFFSVRETGLADYDVLDQWTHQPENNSEYSKLLSSGQWRDEYFLMRAQSMEQAGKKSEATMAWHVLSTSASDSYLQALALQHLAN
ncbi:MAG: hypothetical protein AB8B71_13785 [Paracoccaceae bacterium]